jgi:hypothetical protein
MRSRRPVRRWVPAVAMAAALLSVGVLNPSIAQASAAQGVISGSGAVTDDFGDEATLSRTSFSNSTAVALWQKILWIEGFLEFGDIDCQFGPGTEAATKKFQRRYGLSDDGKVGPNTWSKADNHLALDHTTVGYELIAYQSPVNGVSQFFQRLQSTGYYWTTVNGVSAPAYNTRRSEYC